MTGLMMTQIMPVSENCDTWTKTTAAAGLAVGGGGAMLDGAVCHGICGPKCGVECWFDEECLANCMGRCKKDTCGWLPEGQWARGDLIFFQNSYS